MKYVREWMCEWTALSILSECMFAHTRVLLLPRLHSHAPQITPWDTRRNTDLTVWTLCGDEGHIRLCFCWGDYMSPLVQWKYFWSYISNTIISIYDLNSPWPEFQCIWISYCVFSSDFSVKLLIFISFVLIAISALNAQVCSLIK